MNPQHLAHLAQAVDSLATAFVLGATVWFFFIQSPTLLAHLGREKFVPIQMRLAVILFRALVVATLLSCAAGLVGGGSLSTTLTAAVALLGAAINHFVVVPRALRAGGRSRPEIKGRDAEASTTSFAVQGVGDRTQVMHQLVVAFVVMMLGGVVSHGAVLLGWLA
jgi:hypothetical protein